MLKNKFIEASWRNEIYIYDSAFPNIPFKWTYVRVNVLPNHMKDKLELYTLADVNWLFSNSFRYISLSSEELLRCRSGEILVRDFLTEEEREEYRRNKVRLELLQHHAKTKEESEE